MKKLLSIIALILLISLSGGKVLIVDSTGSGNSKTLSGAIDLASNGDSIRVMPGSYAGAVVSRSLSIYGVGQVKITGGMNGALTINSPGCRISNLSLVGGVGPVVSLSSSDNILSGCTVQGGSTGIAVSGGNNLIQDSHINSAIGIDLTSSKCAIINDTFGGDTGIRINSAPNNTIKGCKILSATGIDIKSSDGNIIEDNSLSGIGFGLSVSSSKANRISNNNLTGSYVSGIDIAGSSGNSISNNSIQGGKLGISLRQSWSNQVIDNFCGRNERAGIYLDGSSGNEIMRNELSQNGDGILIANSRENLALGNKVLKNTYGISLRGSMNNLLRENLMNGNVYHLRVDAGEVSSSALAKSARDFFDQRIDDSNKADGKPICYLVNLSNAYVSQNCGSISLIGCSNIRISNQTISNSSTGILFVNSTGCSIENSSIYKSEYGFYLLNSGMWSVKNCEANACKIGLQSKGSIDGIVADSSAANCTEDGIRIDNALNITVKSSNALSDRTGISIFNSRLCNLLDCISKMNKEAGIMLSSSHKCILRGNEVSMNDKGIGLSGSNACILSANNVSDNAQHGISFIQLSGAEVIGNIAIGNGQGIFIQSSKGVKLMGNNFNSNDHYGLRMSASSKCNITDNKFTMNGISGANLVDCSGNFLYHNIFIDNKVQNAADNGNNRWDAGSKIGGNYWSDTAVQGNPGTTPRSIPSSGVDRYPFQRPNGWR
ncbi:MAG: nitrous oxide reductase family maturation protein NosD [Methanotrichaceae archaeon]